MREMIMRRCVLGLVALLLMTGLWGCDYLGYDETSSYSEKEAFSVFSRVKGMLSNTYRQIPSGFNSVAGAMRASAADNAEEINDLAQVQQFNDGSWSAINLLDPAWGSMYEGIRKTNRFLEGIEGQKFEDIQYNANYDQIIEQYRLFRPQARFLRALFHFELAKRYGGVPVVTKTLSAEEANSVEPSSFQEVIDFVVKEAEAVAPKLPVDYSSVPRGETGRATRGAAMALKARALLYAASPLHNESGDRERWVRAAEAAGAIIDSSFYSLANNYSSVFNTRSNPELIMERRQGQSNNFERANFPVGYEGASPGTAPTQNLVGAYDMQTTGKDIDAPDSGYDPDQPYENRDPRLYQTVIVNNSMFKGRPVEVWEGGLDGPPQRLATPTGYYLKKYVIEDISLDPNNTTQQVHTWVLFRYGEVLLNYAEAVNEAYGPNGSVDGGMTAVEAVNKIRNRVNMPPISSGLSQDAFRQEVREERRVELAFEDHRFWDIRRWEIGPSTTDIYGVDVTKTSENTFDYERVLVEERVWEDRMYLYPIPQSELFKNEALEQNPGW